MKDYFKISYFFWKSRANEEGIPVYIRSKQNSKSQFTYNTGVRLLKDQWHVKKNRPKILPAKLEELEKKLQDSYTDLLNQGNEPTLKDLIENLDKAKKPLGSSIIGWCNDYLNSPYSEGQKKAVKTIKTNITEHNKALTFDKLTKPRIKAFFEHLTKQGVANNSQYKRLRALINVANHANIDIPALTSYELPYSTVNALKTRLTWAEVKSVMQTDSENDLEQVAKDVFLLACFSGLRISDILSLQRGELNDFHYERLQTKTKQPVLVTLHKYNEQLFRKYSKGIKYTRQALSSALKPLLRRSGLTKDVLVIRAVGNLHSEVMKPKYEEISFHSGRRFYARLLNDLGLGGEIARDELGHSFKSITDLYAGSPEHTFRVNRVRQAMQGMEKTMKGLSGLMKVA
ncbi:MAG: tyrosine-type recombinase/integrase [Cyclobacteriaceae bacterium]